MDSNIEKAQEAMQKSLREEIKISVRGLVEFLLRQGNIDHRYYGGQEQAMQEGSRIHRMIQHRMGSEYQAEVFLRYIHPTLNYDLVVEGRADGIIDTENKTEGHKVIIDEIKSTYQDITQINHPIEVHLAQAKCYAYMYAFQKKLSNIKVRITYCNIETEEIRYFDEEFTWEDLKKWFEALMADYQKWSDYQWQWKQIRTGSIQDLQFPFAYRKGQKQLAAYVYQTIFHKRKLFLEAPTGTGKTISTIFPAIKAIGKGMGNRIFYFTAKTITRTAAENTFLLLRQKGLHFKSIIITAKEKICFMEKTECNPDACCYAKGHYNRINQAIYDLLVQEESFSREKIEEYAKKHKVCPFEMSLDISLFADGIICDYNYLFDPHVALKRFFGNYSGDNSLFLIDEAHNLLERGREMYSACLVKEDFLALKRKLKIQMDSFACKSNSNKSNSNMKKQKRKKAVKDIIVKRDYGSQLVRQLEKCNKEFLALKKQSEENYIIQDIDKLTEEIRKLQGIIESYLAEQEETEVDIKEEILEFYFTLYHFLMIYERIDENYIIYTQTEAKQFQLKLFCVNPSANLKECMEKGRSSILFSATFLPIQYYKGLLGGETEDYEVYADSVFDPRKKAVFIASDVTSQYSRRSQEEYYKIAYYIEEVVKNRHGNYMVFFPSYSFLFEVYSIYMEYFAASDRKCVIQQEKMSEQEREEFLEQFQKEKKQTQQTDSSEPLQEEYDNYNNCESCDKMLIGFCVLGGIFGEGIDLKNDSLIGVIIVGTGLPKVCTERGILKDYFDKKEKNGFDYAYRYPGMNKVLQAAGRVIRTAEDIGIIVLLDERFQYPVYQKMFPKEWTDFEVVRADTIARRIEYFWDSWL